MTSTDTIKTREDFIRIYDRSPIKKDHEFVLDNDDYDDEEIQLRNQIHKEDNQKFYYNTATNARKRLIQEDYAKLLENAESRGHLKKIPIPNPNTNKLSTKTPLHGGRKRSRILEKNQPKDDPVSHRDALHININNPLPDRYIFIIDMYL